MLCTLCARPPPPHPAHLDTHATTGPAQQACLACVRQVWNSEVGEERKRMIVSDLASDEPCTRLLYTTPESLRLPQLKAALEASG